MFEKISEVLDVEHVEISRTTSLPVVVEPTPVVVFEDKEEDDFQYAREKIREAINKSTEALDDMLELARASEQARAYEVLNGIANSLASMSESLVKLHKTKKDGKQSPVSQPGSVTNNNVIVSSTEDIISMLRKQREERIIDGTAK